MKQADIDRLAEPYPDTLTERPDPADAIGLDVPHWKALEAEIVSDLTVGPPYGIGWWSPHPGTSRRILISDQLYCCTSSVLTNLVEASLHWLEFIDYADRESDRMADAVKVINGEVVVKAPRPRNPLEVLGVELVRLHILGLVRALAGALDCLAGTIIGVTALPTRILRADLLGTRALLRQIRDVAPGSEGGQKQVEFATRLDALETAAGLQGWIDWLLAFRNMLVHRGRRIEIGQLVPREPALYDTRGKPILRVRVVTQLPLDPGRSDVEVFLDPTVTPVLTEDAPQTLDGLLNSVRNLVDDTGRELLDLWRWRRSRPDQLPQPKSQWPSGPSTKSVSFKGYAPGSFPYTPTQIMSHPLVLHRMRAAALDDKSRAQWKDFD